MTKEQIAALATQVGAELDARGNGSYDDICFTLCELERFATLVRNAALDEAAQKCDKRENVLSELMPKGLCADYFNSGVVSASKRNAAAIRNLKEPTP